MPNPTEEKALDIVLDVKVKVTVQLGSCLLPMRDVLELSPGSVVQLTQQASDPCDWLLMLGHRVAGLVVNDEFLEKDGGRSIATALRRIRFDGFVTVCGSADSANTYRRANAIFEATS